MFLVKHKKRISIKHQNYKFGFEVVFPLYSKKRAKLLFIVNTRIIVLRKLKKSGFGKLASLEKYN